MASHSWNDLKQAADDAGFSAVAAGTYDVNVKKAEAKKTGTGKDKINVHFGITTGPLAGKTIYNDFIISPENGVALNIFFRHMKALGCGPEFFATLPDGDAGMQQLAAALVGKSAQVEVGIRTWNEEDRNDIKNIKPLAGAAPAAGPSAGPTPQPMPQPAPQPQPMPQPQPQPAAAPSPAVTKKDEPVSEVAPAATEADSADVPPDMPF